MRRPRRQPNEPFDQYFKSLLVSADNGCPTPWGCHITEFSTSSRTVGNTSFDYTIMNEYTILVAFGSAFVGWSIGTVMWISICESDARENAIKLGFGEYYLDENHKRQFRFKPVKPEGGK